MAANSQAMAWSSSCKSAWRAVMVSCAATSSSRAARSLSFSWPRNIASDEVGTVVQEVILYKFRDGDADTALNESNWTYHSKHDLRQEGGRRCLDINVTSTAADDDTSYRKAYVPTRDTRNTKRPAKKNFVAHNTTNKDEIMSRRRPFVYREDAEQANLLLASLAAVEATVVNTGTEEDIAMHKEMERVISVVEGLQEEHHGQERGHVMPSASMNGEPVSSLRTSLMLWAQSSGGV